MKNKAQSIKFLLNTIKRQAITTETLKVIKHFDDNFIELEVKKNNIKRRHQEFQKPLFYLYRVKYII